MEKELYNKSEKVLNINKRLKIIIYENETMLVVINNKDNVFYITREEFDIIEQELLDYDFYLYSQNNKQAYYYKIKEPNNEIRYAFENSNKDKIYFGKNILNNKVESIKLEKLISTIGK